MKILGVSFYIALALVYSQTTFAINSCESLFATESFLPQKVANRIKTKASLNFEKYYAYISLDAPLNPKARELGDELLKLFRYFGNYQTDQRAKKITPSKKEILELGDIIHSLSLNFLKQTNIKYKLRRTDILGEERNVIVIMPEGKHQLNIEAKEFQKDSGTELIYNLYDLLASNSEALFYPKENRISISPTMLVEGTVKKDEAGKHEMTHLNTKILFDNETPYLFHGQASTLGTLPGGKGPYSQSFFFDEMDAFLVQARASITNLSKIKYNDPRYTLRDKLIISGIFKTSLESAFKSGYEVSQESYYIFSAGLKHLLSNPDAVEFVKKENYYMASWTIKKENSKDDYFVEIPLLVSERTSRADLLQQLESHLQKQQLAALYYRNTFKVGYDLMKKNYEEGHTNYILALKKYLPSLRAKYNFATHNDVPTQKELAKSLE